MAGRRSYTTGTETALVTYSQGTCYWPDCLEPTVKFVDGKPVRNLQVAHIIAAGEKGPRAAEIGDDECRDFANLILLCYAHHRWVDVVEPSNYPPSVLRQWKAKREAGVGAALAGLQGLTEDRLYELIGDAIEDHDRRLNDAIDRLSRMDSDAAAELRKLLDELSQLRASQVMLDPDSAALLHNAASDLVGLREHFAILSTAADKLAKLPETASILADAANKIETAQGFM